MKRDRRVYAALVFVALLAGLATRELRHVYPGVLTKGAGDALWAAVVYLLIALLRPRLPIRTVALSAALFAAAIEFSQIYHAPWIDSLRRTLPGALILGSVFSPYDFIYYAVGIGVCVIGECLVFVKAS